MRKLMKLAITGVMTAALLTGGAQATTFSQTATITLLTALGVAQTTQLNFGKVTDPASDCNVVVLVTDATTGTTCTFISSSAVAAGDFTVTGSSSNTVTYTVSDGGDVGGFLFSDFDCTWNGGGMVDCDNAQATQTITAGSITLTVGGTAALTAASISEGTYTPAFDIDITYD